MRDFARPIVISSRCLEFEAVRYNGQVVTSKIIRDLEPFVEYRTVCPEVGIGLGIPREPIRIVQDHGEHRLIQPATGADLTEAMRQFTADYIASIDTVDGFIFKSKSPSMGVTSIKVYAGAEKAPVVATCSGFFAGTIIDTFKGYPVEEDDRLRNRRIKEFFLTRLFTLAGYREAREKGTLMKFHRENRLLYRLYGPSLHEAIEDTDPHSREYLSLLRRILSRYPSNEAVVNLVEELLPLCSHRELLEVLIGEFSENLISRESLFTALRCELSSSELKDQSIFEPYPSPLREGAESDHEKDYWKSFPVKQ